MLTEAQRAQLLEIARTSMECHVRGERPLALPADVAAEASGVFVTIKERGHLRGCLGVLSLRRTLGEEVARCACESASEDPRFPPLTPGELPDTSLEISVLGPLEPIDPADEAAIVVGRHGLVVERDGRRGLLLPQVAVEWGWTRDQFLGQTCRKAGLPYEAWQHGARVYRFDADVFGE